MRLIQAEITNFRSIKKATIDFDPRCRVLVGINESGKSNVLKALRLLGEEYSVSRLDDVREPVSKEASIDKSYVHFVFKFDKSETDQIFGAASSRVLSNEEDPVILTINSATCRLSQYCQTRDEGLFDVDVLTETKSAKFWATPTSYKFVSGWKAVSSNCPADYVVEVDGENKTLKSYVIVRAADFPEIPAAYLQSPAIGDLDRLVSGEIANIVRSKLPKVIFWEFREKDLLPNSVSVDSFIENPNSCVPLKNMFLLAGISESNIRSSVEEKLKGSLNQIQNYFDKIADQTTAHFRDVWAEYRSISFSLRWSGGSIVPGIKESNTHDFARRSDGFKRFVTFLLMISVKVKTEEMENTLLLIDEPEISLHPTGARYLRGELIRIANSNFVVYSTHSIFMVDSGNLDRHYIVSKKDEVTTLETAEQSKFIEEEVLWNALGFSAFEVLKEKNIIFEGWKDKRLFEVAVEGASSSLKKKFGSVGVCHGRGASSIRALTPPIELARRICVVVSDGDAAALVEQKRYKSEKGYGTWLTYQDIDKSIVAITGEDFVKKEFIVKIVNQVVADALASCLTQSDLPDARRLDAISKWLGQNGVTVAQIKPLMVAIKDRIFEQIEAKDIEEQYEKLLTGLAI